MRFRITLVSEDRKPVLPLNYSYPLSAVIYRILAKGDSEYASFLHETGYGKGFKFFTFSQINVPFRIDGDRMHLMRRELHFDVAFHLPQAMESFVKGLFQSEIIEIADKQSKAGFLVKSVETLSNPLQKFKERELISLELTPVSPVVAGLKNDKGYYDFLSPDDSRYVESLIFNWRNKIETSYDTPTATTALLMMEVIPMRKPFKSRLITIKADTPEETKIRGWMNFRLKVTGERRFLELLLNAGAGVYNGVGCGCVEVMNREQL